MDVGNALDRLAGLASELSPRAEREQLIDAILAEGRRPAPSPIRRRLRLVGMGPRVRRARLAVPVAAAVLAALALAGVLLPAGRAPTAAAAVLDRVAATAAGAPAPPVPRPGQYQYRLLQEGQLEPGTAGLSEDASLATVPFWVWSAETYEAWVAPDGTGEVRLTYGPLRLASSRDRAAWTSAGMPRLPQPNPTTELPLSPEGLTPAKVRSLPSDPAALRRLIEARAIEAGPPGDAETFTIVGDLLGLASVPADVRAGLYRLAASLPGVKVLGHAADHAGRKGMAVGYPSHGLIQELIFDPRTSRILGREAVVTNPKVAEMSVPAGTEVGWVVYHRGTVVSAIPILHSKRR